FPTGVRQAEMMTTWSSSDMMCAPAIICFNFTVLGFEFQAARQASRTKRQPPCPIGTTGGLCPKVTSDVPLAQSSKPHRASLPLLRDHGSQPAPSPLIQNLQAP